MGIFEKEEGQGKMCVWQRFLTTHSHLPSFLRPIHSNLMHLTGGLMSDMQYLSAHHCLEKVLDPFRGVSRLGVAVKYFLFGKVSKVTPPTLLRSAHLPFFTQRTMGL